MPGDKKVLADEVGRQVTFIACKQKQGRGGNPWLLFASGSAECKSSGQGRGESPGCNLVSLFAKMQSRFGLGNCPCLIRRLFLHWSGLHFSPLEKSLTWDICQLLKSMIFICTFTKSRPGDFPSVEDPPPPFIPALSQCLWNKRTEHL